MVVLGSRAPRFKTCTASLLVSMSLIAGACTSGDGSTLRFARDPFVGVACVTPNSTACDRIGIAVWLRDVPDELVAYVRAARIPLEPLPWQAAGVGHFEGYIQPAGLAEPPLELPETWLGVPEVLVPVTFVATTRGTETTRSMRIPLAAGWSSGPLPSP